MNARRAAWEGMREITPMVVAIVPFGLAIGATVAASDLDPVAGAASGPAILAGAAQMATLQMLDAGTNPMVIIASALLINLRIVLYSASLAPWFSGATLRRRLLLAIPVIDQTHFLCHARFSRGDMDESTRIAYYAGAGGWLVAAWLASQTAAITLGAELPAAARLEFAAPMALAGLLAKALDSGPSRVAAACAAVVAATGGRLPLQSSMLAAILVGVSAGVLLQRRRPVAIGVPA
jgi:predicted branched-subunit amino acid permease